MSTRLTHDLTYDAPLSEVTAMLGDPAFREQVCDNQRALSRTVRIEGSGSGRTVRVEQVLPTEGVPGFAKKIVGDTTTIVQEEEWSTDSEADLKVTIPGKPGEMAGTIALAEAGGTTTETVDIEITVRIPVVGGKVEKLIADLLRSALKSENRTGRAYLAG